MFVFGAEANMIDGSCRGSEAVSNGRNDVAAHVAGIVLSMFIKILVRMGVVLVMLVSQLMLLVMARGEIMI